MTIEIRPISGFPEWLPNMRLAEQQLISTIQEQYELYGFSPLQTPAVERLEVLTAKGGMKRQIYALSRPDEDDLGAELGLRFDLTVPLARFVVQHSAELVFPFRRYQIDKVWRGERAQRGRFREFYQCDIDIIGRGTLDVIHDAEIPCVINSTFEALGIRDFKIHISNRRILSDLLSALGCSADQFIGVLRAIDKTHRQAADKTRQALSAEGIQDSDIGILLDLVHCATLDDGRKILAERGASTNGIDEMQLLIESAESLGMPASRLRPDFTIARGLDYYTSTVYETYITGKEDWGSVCSGGRYDDLAGYFSNQKYPGVGVSIGLSRLFDLLVQSGHVVAKSQSPTVVLVTMQDRNSFMKEYLAIGRSLREHGVPTEVYLEPASLREQIGYAASKGTRFAVIAGGDEFQKGVVQLKDLEGRTQQLIPRDELPDFIHNKLHPVPSS